MIGNLIPAVLTAAIRPGRPGAELCAAA